MSNMSYCRFENTLADLEDCLDNITEEVSAEEHDARVRLIEVAKEIVRAAKENRWITEGYEEEEEDEESEDTENAEGGIDG